MSASDPAMQRFLAPYKRSAGYTPYVEKLSEAERDALSHELAAGGGALGGALSGGSPKRSPPRQNSLALPGPMAASSTSFGEIRNYKQRNVVPKYAPQERFGNTLTESQETGWRALEGKPSEAAKNFSKALSGKA
jgi:hypothetical protein